VAGGTVWSEEGGRQADVRIREGKIVEVGALAPVSSEEVIDAAGLDVLPGMIDAHVHAGDRISHFELADTWESASRAALANGITTLAGFVTQERNETLTAAVERCLACRTGAQCEVRFHLTPTVWPWDWQEVGALVARGFTTFKLYTTYRDAGLLTAYDRIAEVMPRLATFGARLLVHCEDDELLADPEAGGYDLADPFTHARVRPESAEVVAVRRVVEFAERAGCPTHVVHVSTADAAELIAAARDRAPLTCETAPHYLLLDDTTLGDGDGSRFLCTPPLRSEVTRTRLESLVVAGVFDLLASDHCAFRKADKDGWDGTDYRSVPSGIAGLGALVPLAFELLVKRHDLTFAAMVRLLAAGPARLLGVYPRKGTIARGSDADLVVVDPVGSRRRIRSTMADAWETYPGRSTTLSIRHVMVGGQPREVPQAVGLE
jgi:dihydropyrimidinase